MESTWTCSTTTDFDLNRSISKAIVVQFTKQKPMKSSLIKTMKEESNYSVGGVRNKS